jgi:hypothetical protein
MPIRPFSRSDRMRLIMQPRNSCGFGTSGMTSVSFCSHGWLRPSPGVSHIFTLRTSVLGPSSSVGIATDFGLDGPGIESRWGVIFRACPDRPWGPPCLLYNGHRVFSGVESGRGVTLTSHPLLVPRSRKTVELYLYSPWGSSWSITGWKLPTSVLSSLRIDCVFILYLTVVFKKA